MDVSTSLVQAYLHVNGYFTAADYPLVESARNSSPRILTDIDMLAVRLARPTVTQAHRAEPGRRVSGPVAVNPDPALASPPDGTDMIVAEVKQGRAQVNPGSRNRHVLAAALTRFGCCESAAAPGLVEALLQDGCARDDTGHVIRMVLFASRGEWAPQGWHWVHLDHVFRFLDDYLRVERGVLSGVDLRDRALSWLSLMAKCGLSLNPRDPES
jgi:hypothetical protein